MTPLCIVAAVLLAALSLPAFGAPALAQDGQPRWQVRSAQELGLSAVASIGFDASGAAWIGGHGAAMAIRPDGRRDMYRLPGAEAKVTAIASDPAGGTWLATDGHAGATHGLRLIASDGAQSGFTIADGLADDHVRDLAQGEAGDLWLATAGGLGHRAADGSWGRFTVAEGLIHDDAYAVALGRDGDLWVGTIAGLSRLSAAGAWESFTTHNGLAASWVRDLAQDALGNLWCATEAGASFRSPDGVWRTLRRSDGLPADAVTAVAADLAGGIWFATDAGVAYRTAEGGWASLDFQRPLGLEDGVVTRIGIDTQGRPWFVAPAGVSALLAGGPATGRPKIAVARQPAAPTPANVMTPAPRKSATSAALLIEPLTGVVVDAPFIMLGSIPISRSTFSIIFFTVFTLAVIGAFLLLLRILLQLRKRGANAAKPADRATSLASAPANREEEILLPARLNDDESLAPEIAAALAELDRYADGTAHRISLRSDEMSPVPTQEQEMQDSLQGPGEEMPVGAPAVAPPIALDAYTQEATVEDIPALMEQGRDFAHAGRKPAAYDYFSTVTRLAPDHLEAWMWKGATAAHPQEAVRCLQKAVELAPDNERARAGLNWALSRLAASEAPAAEES